MIESTPLDDFFAAVMDKLPHGSGINYDWSIVRHDEKTVTFGNSYDYMNDVGMYDGVLGFEVIYEYNLEAQTAKYEDIKLSRKRWMVTTSCDECGGEGSIDCPECDGNVAIEDQDEDYVECEECKGEGSITCTNCGGSGTEEYDDIDSLRDYLDQCFWEEIKLNE